MTWTKLGEEFPDAARTLSDAAFRTHIEALCWSNRRGLDLIILAPEVRRFAETSDPDDAIAELVDAGWWQPRGSTSWFIGCRFPDWQLESSIVEHRRELNAVRQRRHRLHSIGDHSLCTDRCSEAGVTRYVTHQETRDPVRNGTDRRGAEEQENPSSRSTASEQISARTTDKIKYDWSTVGVEPPVWRDGDPDYPSYANYWTACSADAHAAA